MSEHSLANLDAIAKSSVRGLEDVLLELCYYGTPSVHRMSNGWWCRCQMHVATAGTTFQIDSETNHATPLLAARECAERVVETLKKWAK